jgi:hypothetical protein
VKKLNGKVHKNEVYTIGDAKFNCIQEVLLESKRLDYVATFQNMAPKKLFKKLKLPFANSRFIPLFMPWNLIINADKRKN